MKATLRAAVAGVLLISLAGCQDVGIGCTHARVEAEHAVYDRAAQEVVFTVRVTDRRGNPVADAPVAVIPLYGPKNPGGIPLIKPTTDADGLARGRIATEELKRQADFGGSLTDEWLASFFPHEDINGVFYCKESDHGALPPGIVREVNATAID
jgi:hypothetical protein